MSAALGDHADTMLLLLDKGADKNAVNDTGYTALMVAAERGSIAAVRLLLASNAEVDARNLHDRTALTYAAEWGNTEVAQVLLENGADVNFANQFGDSPLIFAEHAVQVRHDQPNMISILKKFGAK